MASRTVFTFVIGRSTLLVGRSGDEGHFDALPVPRCIRLIASGAARIASPVVVEQRLVEELAMTFRDIYSRVLLCKPSEHKITMCLPEHWPPYVSSAISTVFLDILRAPGLYWIQQPTAALLGRGRVIGLAVDTDEGVAIPVLDGVSQPALGVCSMVQSGHVTIVAGIALLHALKESMLHDAATSGNAPQSSRTPAVKTSQQHTLAQLLPVNAGNRLGRAFPPYSSRGWRPELDDAVVFPSENPSASSWHEMVVAGSMPCDVEGCVGDVARWIEATLQSKLSTDGIEVRVPLPLPLARALGVKPSDPGDASATLGTLASLPTYACVLPACTWREVMGVVFSPQSAAAAVLGACVGSAGGTLWAASGLEELSSAFRKAAETLRESSVLSVQEAVLTALRRAPLPDRPVLAAGIVPYGKTCTWLHAFGLQLHTRMDGWVRSEADAGDARWLHMLPLMKCVRVSRVPADWQIGLEWPFLGCRALAIALGGTVRLSKADFTKSSGSDGNGKAQAGVAGLHTVGGAARVPFLSDPVARGCPGHGATDMVKSDALADACLTPRHWAMYAAVAGDGGRGTRPGVLPLYDWAAVLHLASPPGSEPAFKAAKPPVPALAPASKQTAQTSSAAPDVAAPLMPSARSAGAASSRARAGSAGAATSGNAQASNAAKLELLSARLRAGRK